MALKCRELITRRKRSLAFINNNWYYFDGSGYMKTGWFRDQGNWYYLTTAADGGTEGAMTIGWKKLSGHWYYFNGSGVMYANAFSDYASNQLEDWDKSELLKKYPH